MLTKQRNGAAIYCRLSRDDGGDAESNSIINQRAQLRQYANDNNFIIHDEYVDDGISGTTFERDSFKRMIADIEDGKISVVLCKDLSRLGRNNAMVAFYTEIFFVERNVRFIAINDAIDTAKGENEIMGFKSIINEYYARDISKKIRSSFRTIALKGMFIGCHAPYGYRIDPNDKHHLLVDDETAPIVKEMFYMASEGVSSRKIGIILSGRKILVPRAYVAKTTGMYKTAFNTDLSTEWNVSTVTNILKNREYCGHLVSQKETTKSFKNKKTVYRPESEWVIVKNTHEALISEQIYEKVQSFIRTRKRANAAHEDNIFAGILKCSTCGYGLSYSRQTQRGKTATYICNLYRQRSRVRACSTHYITFRSLYEMTLRKIQKITSFISENEEDLEAFYKQNLLDGADLINRVKQRELDKCRSRLKELDAIIKRLFEQSVIGTLTEERLGVLSTEYEAEQKALKEKINSVNSYLISERENLQGAGFFLKVIDPYKEVTELTPSLLHEFIEKMVVYEAVGTGKARTQRIDIHWRFIDPFPLD